MIKTVELLKGSWLGPWLIGSLCILLLVPGMPQPAAADIPEFGIIIGLVTILLSLIEEKESEIPPSWHILFGHLQTAVEGARLANSVGDQRTELSKLSKALGAMEALMSMTSSCDACDQLRTTLQEIIGLAGFLKTSIVGASRTCEPNGVIQPNEQCDPRAQPTGCPIDTTVLTFCSDECLCVVIP